MNKKPDGNRRLAKRLLEKPWKGHEWGVGKLYTVLEWCREVGVKIVTFYALSLENLTKRPKEEIEYLFLIMKKELDDILSNPDHAVHKNKIKMTIFGKRELLPQDLQRKIHDVEERTAGYDQFAVNFALAYGGRQEIIDAATILTTEGKPVTEETFRQHLWTNGHKDPDLIIRTGGEKRLSNFLPFQSVYAELAFIDNFWPELTKEEFMKVIDDYSQRQRRFGQ